MAPYDVAAWTLPMMMGAEAAKVRLTEPERTTLRALKAEDWPSGGVDGKGPVAALERSRIGSAGLLDALLKAGGPKGHRGAREGRGHGGGGGDGIRSQHYQQRAAEPPSQHGHDGRAESHALRNDAG